MFDEDLPIKKTSEFPRNLDGASVEELQDYIGKLKDEIVRVEQDIATKKESAAAADKFFK
ncbi:MAG: hypothetical protein CBB87_07255 [Micavibrio sp. TMED27]|nr:DUF1192 domain-containing protein [Micavibrio sp.]OUT90918.1 MAG: hypothetical protein CBB87_07255 [Micavibrio sp. TMED27]|tara:strand:+ start:2974 stop:3153 length:180 start_codon:yes stop_codon:yes gene_type:complete